MRNKLIAFFLFAASLLAPPAFSQDTARQLTQDTLVSANRRIDWNAHRRKNFYEILIPATLITYGAIAFKSDMLTDLNEGVKEELWTEHAHNNIHIDNYLQYAPAAAVYALNMAGIKGKNNLRDRTIIYGLSTAIMSSVVLSTKKLSNEVRPDGSNRYSFPSGHTATAFAAAEFLRQEYKDVSPWYGVAGYLAAGATGYMRMYNNKHWLSDVMAGAGIGILSTKLAYSIYPVLKNKIFKHAQGSTLVLPVYQNGAFGLGLVHHF